MAGMTSFRLEKTLILTLFFCSSAKRVFEQLVAFGYFQVITFIGLCGVLGSASTA